jgi:hypothetical protein
LANYYTVWKRQIIMIVLFAYLFEAFASSDVCVLLDQGILLLNAESRTSEKEIIKMRK